MSALELAREKFNMKIITPILGFSIQIILLAVYAFSSKEGPGNAALFAAMWVSTTSIVWMIIRDGKLKQQLLSAMWAAQAAAVLIVLLLHGISLVALYMDSPIKIALDHALPRGSMLAAIVYFAILNHKLGGMSVDEMKNSAAMRRIVIFFNGESTPQVAENDPTARLFDEIDQRRSNESTDFVCDKMSLFNFNRD